MLISLKMPAGTVHGSKKLLREERVKGRAGRTLGFVALVSELRGLASLTGDWLSLEGWREKHRRENTEKVGWTKKGEK